MVIVHYFINAHGLSDTIERGRNNELKDDTDHGCIHTSLDDTLSLYYTSDLQLYFSMWTNPVANGCYTATKVS